MTNNLNFGVTVKERKPPDNKEELSHYKLKMQPSGTMAQRKTT